MLKVLVGVACIAVIAFVGYFFWDRWQANQQSEQLGAITLRRTVCIDAAKRYVANILDHADKDKCVADGYLRPGEIEAIANGQPIR